MVFSVEFERMPYFQGLDGIFEWYVVIFDGVKSGENGVKWSFCRSDFGMKILGNAYFIRSLWKHQMCRSWQPGICHKM